MTTRRQHKKGNCHPNDLILVHEGVQCSSCLVVVTQHTTTPACVPTREQRIQRLLDLGFDLFPETAIEQLDW
jgi:hypothetical protein